MESIWSMSCEIPAREPLPGDRRADAVVIGAGMAGILTAHMLAAAGLDVIVLEAGRIAGGQTRNTTAKITSQHGMIYQKLEKTLGQERAALYAAANETAVTEYRKLISTLGIDCDLEDRTAYVYGSDRGQLTAEAETAAKLGLPAYFTEDVPLPIQAAGAVAFAGQAQFNPLKFIKAVSAPLTVFENTPVLSVHGNTVVTDRGNVQGDHIVFAAHYPFVNFPGLYFTRMHQARSYVLALKNAADVNGMWIGAEEGSYSFRNYGELLLLGGGGHRTGENPTGGCYDSLRQMAKQWYPGAEEVACWSAQDCIPPDSVPYIGRYARTRPHWYVATGFQKWGMSTSMAAAILLRDMVCGVKNPWEEVFTPGRFNTQTAKGICVETIHSAKGLGKRLFQKSRVCPHMGCRLEWDPDEKSWDCPCHGSRFDREGGLLSGPAQKDIPRQ